MRICVFTGSKHGARPAYEKAALDLAALLVRRGDTLVYGGSNVGLMGVLADRVLEEGGRAIGVIPSVLVELEVAHRELTELFVVDSMLERKARMSELSDAFLALPGGTGTLDELFEMLSWAQLGLLDKPVGLLDVEGYFEALLRFLDHTVEEGFLTREHRALLRVSTSAEALLEGFAR